MNKFNMYVSFIFFIKMGFILLAISHLYLKIKHKDHTPVDEKIIYWKKKVEFIFMILMAILLIYLFNPRTNRSIMIDYETKVLLYLFGIILLLTAKWDEYIYDSIIFKEMRDIL